MKNYYSWEEFEEALDHANKYNISLTKANLKALILDLRRLKGTTKVDKNRPVATGPVAEIDAVIGNYPKAKEIWQLMRVTKSKLAAVKEMKTSSGYGLKEAKDFMDTLDSKYPDNR